MKCVFIQVEWQTVRGDLSWNIQRSTLHTETLRQEVLNLPKSQCQELLVTDDQASTSHLLSWISNGDKPFGKRMEINKMGSARTAWIRGGRGQGDPEPVHAQAQGQRGGAQNRAQQRWAGQSDKNMERETDWNQRFMLHDRNRCCQRWEQSPVGSAWFGRELTVGLVMTERRRSIGTRRKTRIGEWARGRWPEGCPSMNMESTWEKLLPRRNGVESRTDGK